MSALPAMNMEYRAKIQNKIKIEKEIKAEIELEGRVGVVRGDVGAGWPDPGVRAE